MISSDVSLAVGTGVGAVAAIQRQIGSVPVIYITAMPEFCTEGALVRVLRKPVSDHAGAAAFKALVRPAPDL